MNLVEQIVAATEASSKVAWAVLLATASVLLVEHFWPENFFGLPSWVIPVVRVVAIFCATLVALKLLAGLKSILGRASSALFKPIREGKRKDALLAVGPVEVAVLCEAKLKVDRHVRLPKDALHTINLLDSGLLERKSYRVAIADGRSDFEIPHDVWPILCAMPEFEIPNPDRLQTAFAQARKFDELLQDLPPKHPAVAWYKANQRAQ